MSDGPTLSVPARDLPVPAHLSPEAQAMLALPFGEARDYPPIEDADAWRKMIATQDEFMMSVLGDRAAGVAADVELIDVDGVRVYDIRPHGHDPADDRVYLEIHGGGLIMGGGDVCRAMSLNSLTQAGTRMWAVDYRMPPDHPYPASLDDCVAAYRVLLRDHAPERVIVGGGSAGGNLVAATILRARDEGLPLPAAAVLITPEVDLTESGDSFATNLGVDGVLTSLLMPANLLYANGHDLADPYLSPLFGDFSKGFPPTILTTGTRDLFLSNTVRMHRALRAAGVEAELHVLEAAGHGGFFGMAPEDAEITREVRSFVARHWG
jgi:acetyl esterase/lipase